MAAQTGRTSKRWTNFIIGDTGNVLRNIPVDSINGVGMAYDEAEVTALQDAVKNALADTPDCTIEISGPFDTSVAAASPALSGSQSKFRVRSTRAWQRHHRRSAARTRS